MGAILRLQNKYKKFAEELDKPSKWETNVQPRLAEIQQWLQDGVPSDQIIKNLDIGSSTWYEYIDKHPVLADDTQVKGGGKVV